MVSKKNDTSQKLEHTYTGVLHDMQKILFSGSTAFDVKPASLRWVYLEDLPQNLTTFVFIISHCVEGPK